MSARKTIRMLTLAAGLLAPVIPSAHAFPLFVSINVAPPPLPVYAQPACPGEGYLWTPGYWAYGPEGYYWVPGTWVRPPRVGYLWTPAYWGYEGDGYVFHPGYWGPHIGFYGGINYGFGYGGYGYEGGYWRGNTFAYNRAVNNINPAFVHNIYERPVPVLNGAYNHVSYNGGNGGVPYRASQQEAFAAQREQHIRATTEQLQHQNFAAQDRQQFASYNHGRPAIAAAPTPGALRPGNNPGYNPGYGRPGFANAPGNYAPGSGRPAYGNQPAQPYANRGYNNQVGRSPSANPGYGNSNPAYGRPGSANRPFQPANPGFRNQPSNPYANPNAARGGFGAPNQQPRTPNAGPREMRPQYDRPQFQQRGQPQREPMQQRQQFQPQMQRQGPVSRPQFQGSGDRGGGHGRH